jgi:nucleotide-binding universal stress UspA family protein
MTFKTILVHLNHETRVQDLLAAAAAVARQTEGHVVGLYVAPPLFMPSDVIMPMGGDFYDQQISEHKAQCERIKTVFDRVTSGEPFVCEWRSKGKLAMAYEPIAGGVVAEARAADLVVVSQANDGSDPPMLTDVPQRVALECGRPVLVVPTGWPGRAYGQSIAIAWNNSREAARATFDAMPFLKTAGKVTLMSVGETYDEEGTATISSAEVAASLARHGLKNIVIDEVPASSGPVGAGILARVAANGCDMLVMGAYGHSRMREFILGGATRHVLKHMTIPVLVSH